MTAIAKRPARWTPEQLEAIRTAAVDVANQQNAQYPQYLNHWDGPEWYLVTITHEVRTKLGLAFKAGDVTLARPAAADLPPHPRYPERQYVTAYSARNRVDTSIRIEHTRRMA